MKPMTAVPLEDDALTTEELARACSVQTTWVVERVRSGLLGAASVSALTRTRVTTTSVTTSSTSGNGEGLRFHSPDLMRARRLAALERDFDANPELAALAVDLIEELESLRRRLRSLG